MTLHPFKDAMFIIFEIVPCFLIGGIAYSCLCCESWKWETWFIDRQSDVSSEPHGISGVE